jgi:hypothetical protein
MKILFLLQNSKGYLNIELNYYHSNMCFIYSQRYRGFRSAILPLVTLRWVPKHSFIQIVLRILPGIPGPSWNSVNSLPIALCYATFEP